MESIRRVRLGILVPSSNTEMEPAINHVLELINTGNRDIQITAHFSRLRVTQISLDKAAVSQFDIENMIQAASLLADAGVEAIAWGGTSAGWLGTETDRAFCTAVEERFKIPATTSTLALFECMRTLAERKLGLVTPYIQEMNDAIRKNFAKEGVEVVDDRCLSITENRAIAKVTTQKLREMLDVIMARNIGLRTVAVFCTNLSAVNVLCEWEKKYAKRNLTVLDSIAITVWELLRKTDVDLQKLTIHKDLGRIFTLLYA